MHRPLIWMAGSLALLTVLFGLMAGGGSRRSAADPDASPLVVYCAASNRAVVEAVKADYEAEFDREVQVQYGPSQTLLSSIEVSDNGDLFLPADDSYLDMAEAKSLTAERLSLAQMRIVLAIDSKRSASIKSLGDVIDGKLRVVQASPDSAAIGKLIKETLQAEGQWGSLDAATTAYRATVMEVANDVAIGAADAGFVFDAVLHTYPDLASVKIPELDSAIATVSVGVIASTRQPAAALHFARYLAATDRGQRRYTEFGFESTGGEAWADVPELSIFAGSMLRPAIEETIAEFEQREGVRVNRVYNGCGILVAQMQAGQQPDAYFACDTEFMNQVHDLFPRPVDVSQNELVILVQKGNPQGIKTLKDLGREGLRVGIGHEKQCAMGWITQNTFREGGVVETIMPNVTVQTPTGDMLVNQLRAGSLDAAVAYLSNAAGSANELDAIRIDGINCSVAVQPWAVSRTSKFPVTAARLFSRIASPTSQEVFAAEGFRWRLE